MTIITTIYAMELEPPKKIPTQQPPEKDAAEIPENSREFLGIYQGHNHSEQNGK